MFQRFVETISQLTSASAVSLFAQAGATVGSEPTLFQVGHLPAVPELASEPIARAFAASVDSRPGGQDTQTDEASMHYFKSGAKDGHLLRIRLVAGRSLHCIDVDKENRKAPAGGRNVPWRQTLWIGFRFGDQRLPAWLETLRDKSEPPHGGVPVPTGEGSSAALMVGAQMAWEAYRVSSLLRDPISGLPTRVEFQAYLRRALDQARLDKRPLALSLVNPDSFGTVNQRVGQEAGDTVLREVADRLKGCLRQTDVVFHYGSAIFAVVLWLGAEAGAVDAVERVRGVLAGDDFLGGAVRLEFSAGLAVFDGAKRSDSFCDAAELVRRADRALNLAQLEGGACTVRWTSKGLANGVGNRDRLSGIFTGDVRKDYGNALLLWDTVKLISAHGESAGMATEFAERVQASFKSGHSAVLSVGPDGTFRLLGGAIGEQERHAEGDARTALSSEQGQLLAQVQTSKRAHQLSLSPASKAKSHSQAGLVAHAIPLLARNSLLGCLYLDGPEDSFALDSSDLHFLSVLANQVAIALDRAELALASQREKERESRELREEVRGLRQALQHSRLVYQSPQMQAVLDDLRRVAPTDATVLLTGESGTGKELLARALHEQSQRHKGPFVTVDCGAIVPNLIEAELFGHKKGAYTGAQVSASGRIVQADGGTIFLDEIGELPLDVQSKLLRFVQEKEIIPVGSAGTRRVDVRIVAATNRDLAAEVAAGRFRRDLYYRLQVVTVNAPPLRTRPDDILPLAHYFLQKFTLQYDKGVRHLGPLAEIALLHHPWPGNVRELQNRILQAVIMCETEEISEQELRLATLDAPRSVQRDQPERPVSEPGETSGCPRASRESVSGPREPLSQFDTRPVEPSANPWDALKQALQQQIGDLVATNGVPVPLGRWLTEDLVLAADTAMSGVARKASEALGMADTTFRRQLDKARREIQAGLSVRDPAWLAVRPLILRLVLSAKRSGRQRVVERARRMLLEEVIQQLPDNDALGAALMGVTVPTFRLWSSQLPPKRGEDGVAKGSVVSAYRSRSMC